MHAIQALEYLVLDASQRINYRVERGITLQQWSESFKHQPIEGEEMGYREACPVLGVSKRTFYKLLNEGYLGEKPTGNGRRANVSAINKILEREAYLIPVPTFKEILEQQQYHMGWRYFYNSFKVYFEEGVNKSQQYVSIANAAKIIYELRKRKIAIEEWPSLENLNRESGLNLNPNTMRGYFGKRIREVGGQPVIVWTYDTQGRKDKLGNKIPPHVYQKVLAEERKKKHNEEIGISAIRIATTMGLIKSSINKLIEGGMRTGVLHPLIGRGKTYLLISQEADLVTSRQVPYIVTLERRERVRKIREQMETGLGRLYPHIQLDHFAEELWYKVKSGDNNAFSMLLVLYEQILNGEARNPIFGTTLEERLIQLYTALYEIIVESNGFPSKGDVIGALRKKLRRRAREENPSWVSLNRPLTRDSEHTFLEFVGTEGNLLLR